MNTCQTQLDALGFIGSGGGREYCRVRNMAVTAQVVVQSALARSKSKGSHCRLDDKKAPI